MKSDNFKISKIEFLTENDKKIFKIIQQIKKYGQYYISEKKLNFGRKQKNLKLEYVNH